MLRRVATIVIAVLMAATAGTAPAYAGGNGGGTIATPLGDFHCC